MSRLRILKNPAFGPKRAEGRPAPQARLARAVSVRRMRQAFYCFCKQARVPASCTRFEIRDSIFSISNLESRISNQDWVKGELRFKLLFVFYDDLIDIS
jgi:hypothetical protein